MILPHRGSEGSGRDSHPAAEQSDPAGEFPEADRAAERLDRHRELDGTGQGECGAEGRGRWRLTVGLQYLNKLRPSPGVHTRRVSVQADQERPAAKDVLPGERNTSVTVTLSESNLGG